MSTLCGVPKARKRRRCWNELDIVSVDDAHTIVVFRTTHAKAALSLKLCHFTRCIFAYLSRSSALA